MRTSRVLIPTIAFATAFMSSCASPPVQSSTDEATREFADLRGLWGKLLAPYRLTARFPPDESTRPGDIFLVCHNDDPKAKEAFPAERIGNLFSTAPASDRTPAPESDRFYPSLPDKNGKIGDPMASKKPHPRLPVASFPALVSKLGDAKSFGISLPTGSGLWGFGASEERNLYYTLSIPLAEVNELPRVQFLQQLAKQNTPEQKEMWAKAKAIRTDFSKAYREVCQEVRLAVVRQTYATRRFSVSLSADRAGALGGQMQMALGKERAKVVEALAAYASDDAQADNQGNQSANSKDAEISRLRKALLAKDLALDLGFPGVRGESANSSETSVKLEYVFDVPVVFAVATLWEQEIGDPPGEGGPPPGVSPNGPDILNKKNAEGVK